MLRIRSGYLLLLIVLYPLFAAGQQTVIINLSPMDGIPITPDNIFNYRIQASKGGTVQIKGMITYRNSNLNLSYTLSCNLKPGSNALSDEAIHPQWQFSSSALRELFLTYKVLPAGTYEYCVSVTVQSGTKEPAAGVSEECLYYKADDMFLINLIDPEDKSKLTEYNPPLTWVANYSFSNELTYRVRVAEIKQGQNAVNAVLRNQSVYDESNLTQNTIVYPVYAKPLVANQPYAWMVDAYYKGILLGGSETWQFIIPADTLPAFMPATRSYVDIKRENGTIQLYALGQLKLKYLLDDYHKDSLSLELFDESKKKVPLKPAGLGAGYGDNRYILNLKDSASLKHMAPYNLIIKSAAENHSYTIPFKYLNPDFQH
jgi:hypothetical protein